MTATINDTYTSTGAKLAWHTEAMADLKAGKNHPLVSHVMCTDICAKSCSFCSVQQRAGDVLPFSTITGYLDQLIPLGLRGVILSGGGNPILYKCKETGKTINDVIDWIHDQGLQIGMISDGAPLKDFDGRMSWSMVRPESLDKLTWLRISMAGLDHDERCVYVPDIDPEKTTLGFSYVAHNIFFEPADPYHGKVSTRLDLISGDKNRDPDWSFDDRIQELVEQIGEYVRKYNPAYVRFTNNCLEPETLDQRCEQLQAMADAIDPKICFVQKKNPGPPRVCYMQAVHPVLAPSGLVFPCDSVVIAAADIGYKEGVPNHKFDDTWAICHWSDIGKIMSEPIKSYVDPPRMCQGCLFSKQANMLDGVVSGTLTMAPPEEEPIHSVFV